MPPSRTSSRCGSTSRARPGAAGRCGCASRSRSAGPCMRCLEPAAPRFEVDAREVEQPGAGDEELSLAVRRTTTASSTWRRGRATRSRSTLPAQITCRPDCAGLCAQCGANLNDDPEHAHEARAGPALGKLSRDPVRVARRCCARSRPPFATLLAAHGRPEAEAVALAHEQAPLDAQDLGAGVQRVPAVPPAAAPAPGLPALRLLRRSRGRARARPRSRPRAR